MQFVFGAEMKIPPDCANFFNLFESGCNQQLHGILLLRLKLLEEV